MVTIKALYLRSLILLVSIQVFSVAEAFSAARGPCCPNASSVRVADQEKLLAVELVKSPFVEAIESRNFEEIGRLLYEVNLREEMVLASKIGGLPLLNQLVDLVRQIDTECTFEDDLSCTICAEPMGKPNAIAVTECGHCFCEGCLMKWYNLGKNTCPTCRWETIK